MTKATSFTNNSEFFKILGLAAVSVVSMAQHGGGEPASRSKESNAEQVLAVLDYKASGDTSGGISKDRFEKILEANIKYQEYEKKLDADKIDFFKKEELLKQFIKSNGYQGLPMGRLSVYSMKTRVQRNTRLGVVIKNHSDSKLTLEIPAGGSLLGMKDYLIPAGTEIVFDVVEKTKDGIVYKDKEGKNIAILNGTNQIVSLSLLSDADFTTYSVQARARTADEIQEDIRRRSEN